MYKSATAVALCLLTVTRAFAADTATPAEAEMRLASMVSAVKSKGPAAGKDVMAADDPMKCRYKDMVCMLLDTADGTFLAQTALAKLVGTKYDADMVDVDGVNITDQLVGPAGKGKVRWEAKWKFTRPDTKKITPRWATCAKADPSRVACVSISQP